MMKFLNLNNCLSQPVVRDLYEEKLKFLRILMNMLNKCISGGYINFAICDFYQDNSFAELTSMVFKSILNQDISEIAKYQKVNHSLYRFVEEFFKKHLELAFLKIDRDLIK